MEDLEEELKRISCRACGQVNLEVIQTCPNCESRIFATKRQLIKSGKVDVSLGGVSLWHYFLFIFCVLPFMFVVGFISTGVFAMRGKIKSAKIMFLISVVGAAIWLTLYFSFPEFFRPDTGGNY